jgi:uncharacterized protein (DUF2062 family)
VVFGGMLAATILAISFVPVFYVIMEGLNERRQKHKVPATPCTSSEAEVKP